MTVRLAEEKDIAAIADLERSCFAEPWTIGQLAGAFARTDFCALVVETDGEITGYICGTTLFENAEIARVAVDINRRRLGLGGKLLDAFLALVKDKGAARTFLEVRVSNAAAIGLYRSRGFAPLRVRLKYYGDGEDGVEMKKDL